MSYNLIRYDEAGGIDLRPGNHYRKTRRSEITTVLLHWGGSSASGLGRYMMRDSDNPKSTHYMIDGSDIYHVLPIEHQAWHAGKPNAWSVGIDFCQQPTVDNDRAAKLRAAGWDVEEIDNPTSRGDKRIVTLNARAVAAARSFLPELVESLGLEWNLPDHNDVISAGEQGQYSVLGHHHTRGTKWDVAPWWAQLFDGFEPARVCE